MRWNMVKSDVPWSESYLDLTQPESVMMLDQLGEGAATEFALSPVAITTPFRILNEEGVAIVQRVCNELQAFATGDERISKRVRSGVYQSAFLRGLASDRQVIDFMAQLARAPLATHPVSHQAIHINYAPDDPQRHVVDHWHCDMSVSFDYVMMVSDPHQMQGGQFEYFLGSQREADEYLDKGLELPPERVTHADFPDAGWAVLMQGHQVVHRAHRLEKPYPRITLIGSFITTHADISDPQDRAGPLVDSDPEDVALIEWARYTAVVASRRLLETAAATDDLSINIPELRLALEESVAGPLGAISQLRAFEERG
jgi:hypothetical protein